MNTSALFEPLTLPNGAVLPNRLCKAAMEENLSAPGQVPGQDLFRLYKAWAEGGVGLVLTGNVMISPAAMTGPGGVVLQAGTDLAPFGEWARIAKPPGGHLWMQINHPGRQTMEALGEQAVAPSAIRVDIGEHSKLMAEPKALDEAEIRELIKRYADTAQQAEAAGFTGVQIHAAHGYLISQFLSPLVNKRTDQWGGSLENRARFLLETVKAVRARVSQGFCVSVKLNSADFQKGGFDVEDAKWVAGQLNGLGIDLLELSGGSYESPAMQGHTDDSSTSKREVYFIDFARDIASVASMPIMVTGGVHRLKTAEAAIGNGVDVLGIGRAMAFVPDLPAQWKAGRIADVTLPEITWKNRTLAGLATMALVKRQLNRLASGKRPKAGLSPAISLVTDQMKAKKLTKRYRAWRAGA
ncbi:NADH:flavin oxidoreductase/NADH oxidase family protein [Hyphomonas sp.]|uniref:NADH:flavin oxidoreductase/NADH oxidase family protein n=1 Tax=Hyphomonas sp. TaxID=87 RepID=UPI0025BBD9C7|nr:NADH:flavin oxidoreductase/NADH oxidase family protein [Hyphomonas sp.]MBI1398843.1 2,4-dienoyl-CoA reductase [Hyphomonas sp.]